MLNKIKFDNDLSEENKQILLRIENEKNKDLSLLRLLEILVNIELILDLFLNINTFHLLLITVCFAFIMNAYIIFKLNSTKDKIKLVLISHYNKITVNKLLSLNKKDLKEISFVRLNWCTFLYEYLRIATGFLLILIGICISYIKHYMF